MTRQFNADFFDKVQDILRNWKAKLDASKGKRGVVARREMYVHHYGRTNRARSAAIGMSMTREERVRVYEDREANRLRNRYEKQRRGIVSQAYRLAEAASVLFDEHAGWDASRGDYLSTEALDYQAPKQAAKWHATEGTGLGLVEVNRTRVYSKAYTRSFGHGSARSVYLVGVNEVGTGFAHSVPKSVTSIDEALRWIWNGYNHTDLVARQGDIAMVRGRGRKMPNGSMPNSHEVVRDDKGNVIAITHPTHPTLRAPGKGERVIVGRRAATDVADETRD